VASTSALFQACASGDLEAVRALIARDPSLARSHYEYRKPLYFAIRENRIDVVRFLLEHDRNLLDLWVDDDPIAFARDRGYAEMEQVLTQMLDTRFKASTKGVPVATALRDHDLTRMRALLDAQPELVSAGDARSNQPMRTTGCASPRSTRRHARATWQRRCNYSSLAPMTARDDHLCSTPLAWRPSTVTSIWSPSCSTMARRNVCPTIRRGRRRSRGPSGAGTTTSRDCSRSAVRPIRRPSSRSYPSAPP
jgi:hypothetical protein